MIERSVAVVALPENVVAETIPVTTTPVLVVSNLRLPLKYNSTCAFAKNLAWFSVFARLFILK